MRKFLKNIFLFSAVFFVIEKVFFLFILASPALENDTRLEQIITGNIHKEIIVLGSSRGARNILASQIQDSLNRSTYNLSYPGSNIVFHEFLLRSLLQFNKAPKVILLAIDDHSELLPDKIIGFRFDKLYPLAKYDYINNEMIAQGEKSFLSKFLALARINKYNLNLKKKNPTLDSLTACGSMPISFQKKNQKFQFNNTDNEYSIKKEAAEKIACFIKFQELCRKNSIELILIFSPNFKNHNYAFENRLRLITSPNAMFYIYDFTNNIYKDSSYYYDAVHLQKKGAVIFTNEIIQFLKQKINN